MTFAVRERWIPGLRPASAALVFTPQTRMEIGCERLKALRVQATPSRVDAGFLRSLQAASDDVRLTIVRGSDDEGSGIWCFDSTLTTVEFQELALRLLRSQLPTYRRFLSMGMCMHISIDTPERERAALRNAQQILATELETKLQSTRGEDPRPPWREDKAGTDTIYGAVANAEPGSAVNGGATNALELDLWLLRNFVFFFGLPLERVLAKTLGENLSLVSQRIRRATARMGQLSAAQIRTIEAA